MTDWRKKLPQDVYRIMFESGTEPPFTGAYVNHHEDGVYRCNACGAELFSSETKYDSGSGWPAFFEAVDPDAIETKRDLSHGMIRTEIKCARCGGHLGHVFEDGPAPTGLRYCVNSKSLTFEKNEKEGEA
jgi:peptide-methionine (R)-S-oxide reductase